MFSNEPRRSFWSAFCFKIMVIGVFLFIFTMFYVLELFSSVFFCFINHMQMWIWHEWQRIPMWTQTRPNNYDNHSWKENKRGVYGRYYSWMEIFRLRVDGRGMMKDLSASKLVGYNNSNRAKSQVLLPL